jgi:ATP adenylyltransferase
MAYIKNHKNETGCVFCDELALPDGPGNLIIHRAEYNCIILNRYPYTSGHAMVVPYVHCSDIEGLDAAIRAEMMELTTRVIAVIKREYQAQGFNVGLNIGEAAGAGISDLRKVQMGLQADAEALFTPSASKKGCERYHIGLDGVNQ